MHAALWQAAVHGQAATTIWVWQRSYDRKSDYWGSILERPDIERDCIHRVFELVKSCDQIFANLRDKEVIEVLLPDQLIGPKP